jgi:hypothetical protein
VVVVGSPGGDGAPQRVASEPLGSPCAGPEPNLVFVDFDDEAMAEATREQWLEHLADEEDGDWS